MKAHQCSLGISTKPLIREDALKMPCRSLSGECILRDFVPCDRKEVAIIPAAVHDAQQAAIAAAGELVKISNEAPPVNFIAALNDGIAKLKAALARLRAEEAE